MIDANQRWDVQEAIDRVSALAEFRPLWVCFLYVFYFLLKHPRYPRSRSRQRMTMYLVTPKSLVHSNQRVFGKNGAWHKNTLQHHTFVRVATGEQCQNRIVFKQLMASGGVHFVQIDSCRVAGVNEIILILLLAKKFNLPVCPHAGGVGRPIYR